MTDESVHLASVASRRRPLGGSFKRPNSGEGLVGGLIFRLITSFVATFGGMLLLITMGALSGWEIRVWMLVLAGGATALAIYFGESIRHRLFERIVVGEDGEVDWVLDSRGLVIDGKSVSAQNKEEKANLAVGRVRSIDDEIFAKSNSGYYTEQTLIDLLNQKSSRLSIGFYSAFSKRLLDIAIVILVLPVSSIIVLVLAALVSLDGHPPFFSQTRIGRGGRTFRIWKLRTMRPDADLALQRILDYDPAARAEWEKYQKLKKDPRVTRIGYLLRRTSLDEIPQLWNVLMGDMSLVGPRPLLPFQQSLYPGTAYFSLRPGITGIWQISQRRHASFVERVLYDDQYAANVSFATDMRILMRTFLIVMKRTGS